MGKRHQARVAKNFKIRQAQRPARTTHVKSHVNPDDLSVRKACQDKRQHLTKQRAGASVSRAERRTSLRHKWYHCRFCGYYHICRVKDGEGNPVELNVRNLVPRTIRLEPKVC